MAAPKERRNSPRRSTTATPNHDSSKGAKPMPNSARAEASAEEIRQLIAETAYYRAKQRGFEPGHELEDWVQAESEILQRVERST
jgi:hypothetical protein